MSSFGAVDAQLKSSDRGGAVERRPLAGGEIAKIVAQEVIPRLVARAGPHVSGDRSADARRLADLALGRDPAALGGAVEELRRGGADVETVLNAVIAPAARLLGDMWACDTANFSEVAIAGARLCQVARHLGVEAERAAPDAAPRALIAWPAAERHNLGALIVAQSFRAAGWRVGVAPGAGANDIAARLSAEHVDLLGLSVTSERGLGEIATAISRARAASRNPRLHVALGGPAFSRDPGRARALGADFAAANARDALDRLRDHLSGAPRT